MTLNKQKKKVVNLNSRPNDLVLGWVSCSIMSWFLILMLCLNVLVLMRIMNNSWWNFDAHFKMQPYNDWVDHSRLFDIRYVGVIWLVFLIGHPPFFDCCVFKWGSNNKHHKDMCYKKIGRGPQLRITTPHPIMNTTRRTYVLSWRINKHALPITTMCSKCVRHVMFNSQHDWENSYMIIQ